MLRPVLLLVSSVQFILALSCALSAPTPPASSSTALGYPESTSGLESLAKDIVNAQSQNDGPREDGLLQSLVLPNAFDWYDHVFDREAADSAGAYYQRETTSIQKILADTFLKPTRGKNAKIRAVRFEQSCDDTASQDAYGILIRRREVIPIYELRFLSDGLVTRLFPLAYVEGAFRFFLFPDFRPHPHTPDTGHLDADKDSSPVSRVTVGPNMQPPFVHKVEPTYPEKTHRENVSGAVLVHVVIDQQGQVSRILGVHGVCSMAESAVKAVRHWRYEPYRVNGAPVEVDTEVRVIYSLVYQPFAGVEKQ